ncbi:tRNA (adenosine(37)-N6)-dimethylallyltransferase MiaA [Zobellia sp. B3R18]|uniref:tRNA (adenosine(37)-N6)-dimethylallyltransferase MiaA n=1 Tax=Zobellia sp. B3R18 TaxID=2841568 RepID=UPI001C06A68F|nr:tRNA (adenosine(37)-N6)-dimethylallyltransferase MiaA [Zobellia sp. B3R18]MBU2976241.1 tRNA (adenosine(37)-N6)-dimethylallyltransferase MiaA [Zobellia sp. B3R18]
MEKILLSVVGPTAIGKTKLAISLAQHYNTEIISADSRQFFKEMRIGTAVPTPEELSQAKHHFIQHISIFDSYSVGDFERDALQLLETLFEKNHIVVMVGGSGLYTKAVTEGLDDFPKVDPKIREQLNQHFAEKGIEFLQKELQERDPKYYTSVDLNNPHRLIRALEICMGTNNPYSSFLSKNKKNRPFKTITIGLEADRALIYDRINQRVDIMVKEGLVEEVEQLKKHKELNALQTVGYRELFSYFEKQENPDYSPEHNDLNFALEEIKKNTRRFAKRQLTWFKRNEETIWIPYNADFQELIAILNNTISNEK